MQKAKTKDVISLRDKAGMGRENVTSADLKLPFLKICYGSAPLLDQSSPMYNPDAKLGDMYNEVTGTWYPNKTGVLVVPCHYINTFVEWKEREQGEINRPVAVYRTALEAGSTTKEGAKDRLENGNYLEDTGNHFCYTLNESFEIQEQVIVMFSKTHRKVSKAWWTMMNQTKISDDQGWYTPATFNTVYKLHTEQKKNEAQNVYFNYKVEFVRALNYKSDETTNAETEKYHDNLQETGVDNLLCYTPGQNDEDEVVVPIENTAQPKIANKKTPTDINQFKE